MDFEVFIFSDKPIFLGGDAATVVAWHLEKKGTKIR